MARLNNDPEPQETKTPAPPKRAKNAFPTFTPISARVLRSEKKTTGFLQLDLAAKKTKIPPGVGLDQIPSLGNLKLNRDRGRGRAGVIKKIDFDKLTEELKELELSKKGTGKGKGKRKGKEVDVNIDGIDIPPHQPTRVTRARSTAGKKALIETKKASAAVDTSDDEPEHFDLNPVVPPGLKSSAAPPKRTGRSLNRANSIVESRSPSSRLQVPFPSPERVNPAPEKTRGLLLSFKGKMSQKLWEVDENDMKEMKGAIDNDGDDVGVLGSMLEVVEKFQAFRDCLDGFLEVDGLRLGLDRGSKEETDEEEWRHING